MFLTLSPAALLMAFRLYASTASEASDTHVDAPAATQDASPVVDGTEVEDLATADLEEVDRQLNNPLTKIWSLTFQNNTGIVTGDEILEFEVTNTLLFQPFLPFAWGKEESLMFTLRPVFPLVTRPVFDEPGLASTATVTGFADMQLLALIGPNNARGLVPGAGVTMTFPTATDESLGAGKWQVGPSLMLFFMGKPWVAGTLVQHWSSFAGREERENVHHTDFQYIIRRSLPGAWSLGMGPTITVDWTADSHERLTLPVGLGLTKTIRIASLPMKLRVEAQYSVVQPESSGTTWNFRLQVTPVIPNPID